MPSSSVSWSTILFRLMLAAILIAAAVTYPRWQPLIAQWRGGAASGPEGTAGHDEHGHDHAHSASQVLELSPQALKNLGLERELIKPLVKRKYQQSVGIPAMVVELPGRTHLEVSTPLTGLVEQVRIVQGEAVLPGTPLFQIRLTHEDLVQSQVEYLKLLGERDVVLKEIVRLREATQSGAVAERALLEQTYAQQKLQAGLDAQQESLVLHGLNAAQIDAIASSRKLLKTLQIRAPAPDASSFQLSNQPLQQVAFWQPSQPVPLVVHELTVHQGEAVSAGEALCTLADLSELSLEGSAFERDETAVLRALEKNWPVTAEFETGSKTQKIEGLEIHYLADQVDPLTRALKFYVRLKNELVRDSQDDRGRRFIAWRYRPGQRLQLRIPVNEWTNEFILPVDGVVRDGAENYVFIEKSGHFERRPVHVKYRDQEWVVLADDGSLLAGDAVAHRGAHQMQMALKNLSGGAVDPHAGHNH